MVSWVAFSIFGFYVGSLCGLSTSPITLTLMPLLFTFAGGSIFVFFGRMTEVLRKAAISALGCVALGALLGTYSAILVTSHQMLGPVRSVTENSSGYLRSGHVRNIEAKLIQLEQGSIKPLEAARQIRLELAREHHE